MPRRQAGHGASASDSEPEVPDCSLERAGPVPVPGQAVGSSVAPGPGPPPRPPADAAGAAAAAAQSHWASLPSRPSVPRPLTLFRAATGGRTVGSARLSCQ